MRTARIRYDRELCYYHLMNRVAGERHELPFGAVEKEQFFQLVLELNKLYSLELISVVVMSNHYHIVAAASPEPPEETEIRQRWEAYYSDKSFAVEPRWQDPEVVAAWGERIRDISCFSKDLQQRFTSWYNRTRPTRRRGRLWADRFKNVILEGETALWDCVVYVEMNPVRAKICATSGEYRFGTWGRYKGSGNHPFHDHAVRHLRQHIGNRARFWRGARVLRELDAELAQLTAAEQGCAMDEAFSAAEKARRGDAFVLTVHRRVRYWSDGAIIGSKSFVRRLAGELIDAKRAEKRQLSCARESVDGQVSGIYSWRHLQQD